MAEQPALRPSEPWTARYPFLRLFSTFGHALDVRHMAFALAALISVYLYGRVLDAVWVNADGGVTEYRIGGPDERMAFVPLGTQLPPAGLVRWQAGPDALDESVETRERGPFIAFVEYEMSCFSAAIRGALTFNWGFAARNIAVEPSLGGGIAAAVGGVVWLAAERPFFLLLLFLGTLLSFAYFGGALCRSMVVKVARDESIDLGRAARFACNKYLAFVLAPAFPLLLIAGGAVVLIVAGLFSAIPVVGEILGGLLFFLQLLLAFGMAMILVAWVLGGNLLWPRIAAEGSDAFDGIQSFGYLGQRPWHFGFYAVLLLLYGAVGFVMVRLIAMLLLKLTHTFSGIGLSVFGAFDAARAEGVPKLSAMWSMPAWTEMSLLPPVFGPPFYGVFGPAELSWSETAMMWLIAVWVFLVVAGVGAFVISFFYCGSVQMYLLLRREVDAVDFEEVYYEEEDEELVVEGEGDGIESHGTSLPVMPEGGGSGS